MDALRELPNDSEAEPLLVWSCMVYGLESERVRNAVKQLKPEDFIEAYAAWLWNKLKSEREWNWRKWIGGKNQKLFTELVALPALHAYTPEWQIPWLVWRIKEAAKRRNRILEAERKLQEAWKQ